MITKAVLANGTNKEEAKYLPLIDKYLAEVKAIQKDVARKRMAGRKIIARMDRNLKEIEATLNRVAATH